MSNVYNFQFLQQTEERGPARQAAAAAAAASGAAAAVPPPPPSSSGASAADILVAKGGIGGGGGGGQRRGRPDADKLFDVVAFLQRQEGHRAVTPEEILAGTQVDLRPRVGRDLSVHALLEGHPKVAVHPSQPPVPDGLLYQYRAKHEIKDRRQLLGWLARYNQGLPEQDVRDAYPGVIEDLKAMVRAGDLIALKDDRNALAYFPRGPPFLVQLSGTATPYKVEEETEEEVVVYVDPEEGGRVTVTADLRPEVRRGEAVRVGEEWFRVSTLEDRVRQTKRAEAPLSVTHGAGRLKWPPPDYTEEGRAQFKLKFQGGQQQSQQGSKRQQQAAAHQQQQGGGCVLPVSHAPRAVFSEDEEPVFLVRHGCTSDVRDLLWAATRAMVPSDERELRARLQEAALGTHQSGPRRPKMSAAAMKQQANKRKRQDKEAAWREQVRAKAAAVQAQQKQGGTHKRPPAPSKKG